MPEQDLPEIIDGRFQLGGLLGRGGMCTVYRATHLQLERDVALKLLHAHLTADPDALQRFKREAVTVGTLRHPNIVELYGFGIWNSQPYMAMEYLNGVSLADKLRKAGRISEPEAIVLFAQICDALTHAHEKGIAHRDLKPSNVMIVDEGQTAKLVDFGIARILPESGKEIQKLTQTGQMLGTVMYMSPEQCSGHAVDTPSDIYSLGCLMQEVLTGSPPFVSDAPFEVLTKHLTETPPAMAGVSPELASIVLWALEKDVSARPQTANELKGALLRPVVHQRAVPSKYRVGKRTGLKLQQAPYLVLAFFILFGFAVAMSLPVPSHKTQRNFPHSARYYVDRSDDYLGNDPDKSMEMAKLALEVMKETGRSDSELKMVAWKNLGFGHCKKREFAKAVKVLDRATGESRQLKKWEFVIVCEILGGEASAILGDHQAAISKLEDALAVAKLTDSPRISKIQLDLSNSLWKASSQTGAVDRRAAALEMVQAASKADNPFIKGLSAWEEYSKVHKESLVRARHYEKVLAHERGI